MIEFVRTARFFCRVATVAVAAASAQACSSVPDWVDPTTWGESSAPEPTTGPADATASAPATPGGKTVAEASDQYPAVADIPSKPTTSSDDERKQVANALVADRTQAQYSAEALQAGNEPAAAPPPPAEADVAPAGGADAPPAADKTQSAAPPAASSSTQTADAAASPPMPGTLPSSQSAATSATEGIPAAPPPAAAPAAKVSVAPSAPARTDDAAYGFQPSHAPPLNPSVAQIAGGAAPSHGQRLAALSPAPISAPSGPPIATVIFALNSMALDANGAAQVQAAITAYRTQGRQGYVRVVGHAGSGNAQLPADRKMIQSLEQAQACATAVARELIRQGVPANRVLVDASGSLAQDDQRRAEIFLQS